MENTNINPYSIPITNRCHLALSSFLPNCDTPDVPDDILLWGLSSTSNMPTRRAIYKLQPAATKIFALRLPTKRIQLGNCP
ncbi:hypothetical protein I7I48_10972 [Histoplasma ohiense]|nr:hypothetical protein I7I48_10972 [Histoplasma ohiense (nom. inval.)]